MSYIIRCDKCGKEKKYTVVSTYEAVKEYLMQAAPHYKEKGLQKGWKLVAEEVDVGYGRYAVVCAECLKKLKKKKRSYERRCKDELYKV